MIIKAKCVEEVCGKEFEIDQEEARFFQDKNLDLPKRCKECRARRREERKRAENL